MHLTKKVKSPNNISKWQMGFNSAFKVLTVVGGQSYQRKNGSQQIMKAPIIMPRVRAALCSVLQLALCCLTVVPAIKGTFQP
jgi:hypothetical protein